MWVGVGLGLDGVHFDGVGWDRVDSGSVGWCGVGSRGDG